MGFVWDGLGGDKSLVGEIWSPADQHQKSPKNPLSHSKKQAQGIEQMISTKDYRKKVRFASIRVLIWRHSRGISKMISRIFEPVQKNHKLMSLLRHVRKKAGKYE